MLAQVANTRKTENRATALWSACYLSVNKKEPFITTITTITTIRRTITMTPKQCKQQLESHIKLNNLYGHSFTYGQALYELIQGDRITDEALRETIETYLTAHVTELLEADYDKVADNLSLYVLAEITDLAVLGELASDLIEDRE